MMFHRPNAERSVFISHNYYTCSCFVAGFQCRLCLDFIGCKVRFEFFSVMWFVMNAESPI